MKKLIAVVLAASLAACLSSCSAVQTVIQATQADEDGLELSHLEFTRLVTAINTHDAAALKKEFSASTAAADTDLDSEIARLFALLPDGVWSWRQQGCSYGGESDGKGNEAVNVDCSVDLVLDSTTPLHMSFLLYTYNTVDRQGVGIYAMNVSTGDDRVSLKEPGLVVADSPPIIGKRL